MCNFLQTLEKYWGLIHALVWNFDCMKSVRIHIYSGLYFSAFGLNTERCGVFKYVKSAMKLAVTNDYFENYSELNLSISK